MKCVQRAYVTFRFSPAFILESKGREQHLVEEETRTALTPGTLARVLEQYKEVEIVNWDLNRLKVPKGALRFYFYYRMTATLYNVDGQAIEMRSDPIGESAWYYLETEGDLFTHAGLEGGNEVPALPPKQREYLLCLMDKHDSSRIIQIHTSGGWDVQENFVLSHKDVIIEPSQVQMVDTEIPWQTH